MKLRLFLICLMLLIAAQGNTLQKLDKQRLYIGTLIQEAACLGCRATIWTLSTIFLNSIGIKFFHKLSYYGCATFLFDSAQCHTIMDAYVAMIMNNLAFKTFEPNYFCEVEVPVCKTTEYDILTSKAYTERVLSDKPDFIKDNNYINRLYEEIEADRLAGRERETMLMYHLSDLHWNLNYEEGTNNDCGAIVCCTRAGPPPTTEEQKAGKWGDYKCDGNPRVLEQLKHTIEMTGEPDFITWTGDNPDHGIYKDPTVSTNATIQITKLVEQYSPKSVVFPIHGNHEFDPMNTEDFNVKEDPVIKLVADSWSHWLTPKVKEQYLKNTYYDYDAVTHPDTTAEFKRKMDKTRIIAINSQNCYFYNFYLIGQRNDPGQQFEWLENLLREMEQKGEVGILMGHMSPGVADCLDDVSSRLRALMDRFQHIIRVNVFGHTHEAEVEIIRSVGDNKPIGVNHVEPSLTTFDGNNPSFRALTLDVKTKLPVKIETFTFDITKANKDDEYAKFFLNYDLAKEYGLKDLSPASLFNLTTSFKDSEELSVKYLYNKHSGGPSSQEMIANGCDAKCRRMLSCHTSNSVYFDAIKCMNIFDIDNKVFQSYLWDFVYGRWVVKK